MTKHIGVFDSGVGGLSVLSEIHRQLPEATFSYIADSAFTPYGNKSREQIIKRCHLLTQTLVDKGADVIVVACNTATALAIDELRNRYPVPLVAMEPALKPAAEQSKTGKVLILATAMTLSSDRYYHLLERFSDQSDFIHQACPGLVEIVEEMTINQTASKHLIAKYVSAVLNENIDSIVLGCTHYPFLRKQIIQNVGEHVNIIETSQAVTRQVKKKLEENKFKKTKQTGKAVSFYTTGDKVKFNKQLAHYWEKPVQAEQIKKLEL